MERAFTQKLREFLDNPGERTWNELNIDDYILDDPVFDQELTAAVSGYTDSDSLQRAYDFILATRNSFEDSSNEEFRRKDNLSNIIRVRINELVPPIGHNPSESNEPFLLSFPSDRLTRESNLPKILILIVMGALLLAGFYLVYINYFP